MEWAIASIACVIIPGAIWLVFKGLASAVDSGHQTVQSRIDEETAPLEPDPWETGLFVTEDDPQNS